MATETWASVPWEVFPTDATGENLAWHKHLVPYVTDANALQNLDVWIPFKGDATQEKPAADSLPAKQGVWVIYVHGGAWRDPLVTSASFTATVKEILSTHPSTRDNVAGFASINYELTCHPNHPTHPAPPKEPGQPIDPSRQATHPDHIVDVMTGLSYLQKLAGFGSNYVILGHSCGATLAFQLAMDHSKWGPRATTLNVAKPKVLVGLNGLYDMPTLIREPRAKHEKLKLLYEDFTRRAFGDDQKVWHDMCPCSVTDWASEWTEGTTCFLVQSKEDNLVPYWQLEDQMKNLQASKAEGLVLKELEAYGDHNELWQKGDRLAQIVDEAVQTLL